MNNYIMYRDEFDRYIVEILNETIDDLYAAEKDLIYKGFAIIQVIGKFIKCRKAVYEEVKESD